MTRDHNRITGMSSSVTPSLAGPPSVPSLAVPAHDTRTVPSMNATNPSTGSVDAAPDPVHPPAASGTPIGSGAPGPADATAPPPGETAAAGRAPAARRAGSAPPEGAPAPAAEGTLLDSYDALLLDLDGVVYLGRRAVPGAPEALTKAAERGVRLAYVTNNASRTPGAIAEHLTALGVPATPGDVVTSAQAAARLVAEGVPPGSPVLVVGGMGLRQALRAHGLRPVSTAAEEPAAVVQGIAPDLSYALLSEGVLAVRRGAWFVAANGDTTMPTARGELPGNGSMSRVIATAAGVEPVVAGKPEPPLHRESILRTGARNPLIVGDRLDTDIAGANRAGADSLLVLTGVATPLDALTAIPAHRPTHIAADLGGLHRPPARIAHGPEGWICGGWTASWEDGRLRLDRDAAATDPLDGLRAACAATWAAVGDGRAEDDQVKNALATLGL